MFLFVFLRTASRENLSLISQTLLLLTRLMSPLHYGGSAVRTPLCVDRAQRSTRCASLVCASLCVCQAAAPAGEAEEKGKKAKGKKAAAAAAAAEPVATATGNGLSAEQQAEQADFVVAEYSQALAAYLGKRHSHFNVKFFAGERPGSLSGVHSALLLS